MSRPALQFEQVSRRFGKKCAVDRLDLVVEPGSVVGLVGRNGSGKTTSLRIAHGLLYADSGRVDVLGLDPQKDGLEIRRRVSLLAEESSLYPWMTVGEILQFGAALHPNWDAALAAELTKKLDLAPKEKIASLSRGTRAKVALVLSAAVRPELLLLDDPTAGLDPLVRREVLQGILETVAESGGAVVYASHLVHDIERISDRVLFLDAGQKRFDANVDELKRNTCCARAVFDAPLDLPTLKFDGQIDLTQDGRLLTVIASVEPHRLEAQLKERGGQNVEIQPLSLEEILIAFLRTDPELEATRG